MDPKVFLPVKRALGSFFMYKIILFVIGLIIFLSTATGVRATFVAGNSAAFNYTTFNSKEAKRSNELMIKKIVIKKILEKYNSPLVNDVDAFISTCYKYELDCYLLPSISGIESTFGKFIYPGSFNPFGWGGGMIMFGSYSESIETVGKGLRENYINRGAETIEQIGRIYCTGNTWAGKVMFFMNQFNKEEENQLILKSNTVEL